MADDVKDSKSSIELNDRSLPEEAAPSVSLPQDDSTGPKSNEEGDHSDQDRSIAQSCQAHIDARRTTKLKTRVTGERDGRRRKALEMLSHRIYGEARAQDEVDDDFFHLGKDDGDLDDLVQIGVVPINKRGTGHHRKGHKLRRWKNKRGEMVDFSKNGGAVPDEGDIEEDDVELSTPPNGTAQAILSDSPTRSIEAIDFADRLNAAASSSTSTTPAATPRISRTATTEFFTTLPPLSEHPSRSSVPDTINGRASNELYRPPTRTLTIDQPLAKPKRRDTFQSSLTSRTSRAPFTIQGILKKRRELFARGQSGQLKETEKLLALALADVAAEEGEQERIEVDILYEHQRGLLVLGLPKFSSAALFQLDPSPWTDGSLSDTPFTRHDHPLPTPFWHWLDDEWMVDMGSDCDEHGWSYAFRFRSHHWRGVADGWRSFVRRRRWVRARVYIPERQPEFDKDKRTLNIDWDALEMVIEKTSVPDQDPSQVRNDGDQAAEPLLKEGSNVSARPERTSVIGLKGATALLPLSHQHKDDIFSWEVKMDEHDPFLAWSFVRSSGGDAALEAQETAHLESMRSEDDLLGQWRDAVVEINYRRIARVMRMCLLDREKLVLWRWWLGNDVADYDVAEESSTEDQAKKRKEQKNKQSRSGGGSASKKEKRLFGIGTEPWRKSTLRPAMDDVWDLLEGRLDHILQMFEFQATRISLLRIVLAAHPITHAHHKYSQYDRDEPFIPGVLSPRLVSSRLAPRLAFFNDLVQMTKSYEGTLGDAVQASGKNFEDVEEKGEDMTREAQRGQKRQSLDVKVPRR